MDMERAERASGSPADRFKPDGYLEAIREAHAQVTSANAPETPAMTVDDVVDMVQDAMAAQGYNNPFCAHSKEGVHPHVQISPMGTGQVWALAVIGPFPETEEGVSQLRTRMRAARLVDGPGCTPVRAYVERDQEEDQVPNEAGTMVPAGSLYADKCEECTTGLSCEDARRCLFEG